MRQSGGALRDEKDRSESRMKEEKMFFFVFILFSGFHEKGDFTSMKCLQEKKNMPALKFFGRKWLLSTDDFVLFPAFYACMRLAMAILLAVSFRSLFDFTSAAPCSELQMFAFFGFLLHILLSLVHVAMSVASAQGAVFQLSVRHTVVPSVMYVCMVLWLGEVVDMVFGCMAVYYGNGTLSLSCTPSEITAAKTSLWTSFTLLLFHAFILLAMFDIHGRDDIAPGWRDTPSYGKQWERRVRILFCCARPGKANSSSVYADVAKLFANMFRNVDLVPSDLAAGIALLREEDKRVDELRSMRTITATMRAKPLLQDKKTKTKHSSQFVEESVCQPNALDRANLDMLVHFSTYMIASYGWPMMLLAFPLSFGCRMFPWLLSSRHAIRTWMAEHPRSDFVCFSDANTKMMLPYFVAVDHDTCTVMISIRGTLSVDDILADIWAEVTPLDAKYFPGGPPSYVHKGMLECASKIVEHTETTKSVSDALAAHPSYTLVVCGHSLGAGVSVLMALLLREKYPTLRCFSYSPPGALCTRELADYCGEFTVSVVVGKDIVARLSEAAIKKVGRSERGVSGLALRKPVHPSLPGLPRFLVCFAKKIEKMA